MVEPEGVEMGASDDDETTVKQEGGTRGEPTVKEGVTTFPAHHLIDESKRPCLADCGLPMTIPARPAGNGDPSHKEEVSQFDSQSPWDLEECDGNMEEIEQRMHGPTIHHVLKQNN